MSMRSRIAAVLFSATCAAGAGAQGALVDVVEYYHAGLDHYFVSSLQGDIAALDSGTLKGWARTGLTFKAYDAPAPDTSPVCRFYIPPAQGNSHFYSASPAECAEVAAKFPAFSYESPGVMYVGLPDAATGACRNGWAPVFRLWNQRADSNHRYTTDRAIRSQMLAQGYVAEGYGPEGVAMCAPGINGTFDVLLSTPEVLLLPGDVRNVYITVTPQGGFTGNVTLALSSLPPGVTGELSAQMLTVGADASSAVLRLSAAASASPTSGNVSFIAQSGSVMTSTALTVGLAATSDPVAVRLRAIAAVEERLRELLAQGSPLGDTLPGMAAFMAAHPDYEEAGVDVAFGNAWGRQKDGTVHVVAGNYDPAPSGATRSVEPHVPKSDMAITTPYALLLGSIWSSNAAAASQIRQFLSDKGWYVKSPLGLGLKELAKAKYLGFLYLDGPSGRGRHRNLPNLAPELYGVASDELVSAAREKEFDLDRTEGALIIITGLRGANPIDVVSRYGITEHFVRKYMPFQPDGVVFVNAPRSSGDAGFVQAFHDQKASVYLGWDGDLQGSGAGASQAATYFVDRMVGANRHPVREDPPQRPFPYDLVLADMRMKGLDRAGNARLAASPQSGTANRPIFAPSIQYVTVDELEGLLKITGEFGSPTPKVTVDGAELGLKQWSKSLIVAHLPFSGKGSNGDVLVEVNGVRSNARQLSDWAIPLAYDWTDVMGGTGLKIAGTGQLRFRADVGGYREMPAEKLRYKVRYPILHRDGKLTLTASGSHTEGKCTHTASGMDDFYSTANPFAALNPSKLVGWLRVDSERMQANLHLRLGNLLDPILTYVVSGPNCGNSIYPMTPTFGELDDYVLFPTDASDQPVFVPLPAINLSLNDKFALPSILRIDKRWGGTIRITSPTAAPPSPPRETPDAGR